MKTKEKMLKSSIKLYRVDLGKRSRHWRITFNCFYLHLHLPHKILSPVRLLKSTIWYIFFIIFFMIFVFILEKIMYASLQIPFWILNFHQFKSVRIKKNQYRTNNISGLYLYLIRGLLYKITPPRHSPSPSNASFSRYRPIKPSELLIIIEGVVVYATVPCPLRVYTSDSCPIDILKKISLPVEHVTPAMCYFVALSSAIYSMQAYWTWCFGFNWCVSSFCRVGKSRRCHNWRPNKSALVAIDSDAECVFSWLWNEDG